MLRWSRTENFLPPNTKNTIEGDSAEWKALLECARPDFDVDRLHRFLTANLDWRGFVKLAEDQGILPLCTSRLGMLHQERVPPEIRQQLREASRAQTLFTLSLTAELFRILDRFAGLGIEVLLTKGPALSERCYGHPGLRQYCDLDLIVRSKDMGCSTEAMVALNYEPKVPLQAIRADKAPGEYVFMKCGSKLLVEFHTERTFRYHPKALPIDKLFARQARVRFDGRDVPSLSVEDELILICIHGAKHFWERLLWIADVAALVSVQTVDWNAAMRAAEEVQAERMLRVGLELAARVVHAQLPAALQSYVQTDSAAASLAGKIARRLAVADAQPMSLLGRAEFRVRMGGGPAAGLGYLLRLSFSPTEEDWVPDSDYKRSWLRDAIARPFRLARKYGRDARG
jgi:hypothetical protein